MIFCKKKFQVSKGPEKVQEFIFRDNQRISQCARVKTSHPRRLNLHKIEVRVPQKVVAGALYCEQINANLANKG